MTPQWIRNPDAIPTPKDLEHVARVLEAQHGMWAESIADFFADCHDQRGDTGRSWAWTSVADLVRERQNRRDAEATDCM